jgi:hypothetical protein
MSFTPMKLKPESGANRIRSADDAYSFMAHLRLSYRSKSHWQAARQALDNVCASDVGEFGLGEPSEPPCPQKAGSRTEPSAPCSIRNRSAGSNLPADG